MTKDYIPNDENWYTKWQQISLGNNTKWQKFIFRIIPKDENRYTKWHQITFGNNTKWRDVNSVIYHMKKYGYTKWQQITFGNNTKWRNLHLVSYQMTQFFVRKPTVFCCVLNRLWNEFFYHFGNLYQMTNQQLRCCKQKQFMYYVSRCK